MILNTRRTALAAILLFSAHSAFAGPADEARALMAQGLYVQALQKIDQHLAKNPQDAEARFSRGIALTKLHRTPEAMRAFTDLTRDYPQLPEPYNNLAVLYAQQGNYEKARDALEAALATHPSYATAHENLGDIYAALAGASYNRALTLDKSNQAVRSKLDLISQVEKPVVNAPVAKANSTKPVAPAVTPTTVAPVIAAPPAAAPAATPAAPVAPTVAPVATAPSPAKTANAADASTTTAVTALLESWSQAWSAKDAPSYLGFYADDFSPEGGQLRAAWAEQRRERILKPARIKVGIKNPKTTRISDDRVRVSFLQSYQSDNYSDSVNKILELKQVNGAWKIAREYSR
ncbi:MAG: tetratricopeptide repeat protein [Pseudomonadota bacterium]